MLLELAIAVLVSCIISAIFTFISIRKASDQVAEKLLSLHEGVQEKIQEYETYLEPILLNNKKAFTLMGMKGNEAKDLKALEASIGEDLLDKYAPDLELLELTFPRAYERVKDKPDLIIKYWPRFQELIGNTDMKKLGFSQGSNKDGRRRAHREGLS